MSFDPMCHYLAKDFLSEIPELNTEKHMVRLAQDIQDTIDNYIRWGRELEAEKMEEALEKRNGEKS